MIKRWHAWAVRLCVLFLGLSLLTGTSGSAVFAADQNTAPSKTLGDATGLFVTTAVAVDSSNNLYVANAASNSVTMYQAPWASGNTAPTKILQGNSTGLSKPSALAVDDQGTLYVANPEDNTVTTYASTTH